MSPFLIKYTETMSKLDLLIRPNFNTLKCGSKSPIMSHPTVPIF
jgi:hypothetical protein